MALLMPIVTRSQYRLANGNTKNMIITEVGALLAPAITGDEVRDSLLRTLSIN